MKIINVAGLVLPLFATISIFPAQAQEEYLKYACEDGKTFEVTVRPDKARLKLDGTPALKLLPLDAREGLKFAAKRILLTMVNQEASIEINDKFVYSQCIVQ